MSKRSFDLLRLAAAGLGSVLVLALAAPAQAAFGVAAFDGQVTANEAGDAYTQAGGHPYAASVSIDFNSHPEPIFGFKIPDADVKTVQVDLPPGLIGNPTVTPKCTLVELFSGGSEAGCPPDSQIGIARTSLSLGNLPINRTPLYNMVAQPGQAASFAFMVASVPVFLDASVRPGDHGVTITVRNVSQGLQVHASGVDLWGNPASPAHDAWRCQRPDSDLGCNQDPADPNADQRGVPNAAGYEPRALLSNPTACTPPGEGLETRLRIDSWQDPGAFESASFVSHLPPAYPAPPEDWGAPQGPTGCEQLPFDPSVSIRPGSDRPDAPTGLTARLAFPQDGLLSIDGLATAHLQRVEVAMPEGLTINPAAADGLAACSDGDLGLGTDAPVACPPASRIGQVVARTPLLEEALAGELYVRTQNSSDPESGEMFRLALVVESPARGVRVKLAGSARADARTGRLVALFDQNPQLPLSSVDLTLKDGPRAPLATPRGCGGKTIRSELSSWAMPDVAVVRDTGFEIACSQGPQFAPTFEAGTVSPVGGRFSPFVAAIERSEGQQFLSGVDVELPRGLVAKLRDVELCPDAVAGDGTPGACPAGSRVGSATVGAGAGNAFYLTGDAYLTGPYKGAPYGLSVQVRAKAGPFDLGMVKVRQAIHVDPVTAELRVASDPLPQVVKGVPVRLRDVRVDVDRPDFTVNPTSCDPGSVRGTVTSIDGVAHRTASRFQVGDCEALAFKPRLAMRLSGRKQRRTGGHPGLRAVLRQAPGQANVAAVRVELPRSLALDPKNANGLCGYEEGLKVRGGAVGCPASSVIGHATADVPLLKRSLRGKVYFVEHKQRSRQGNLVSKLPSLLVALRGEVAIDLRARSAVRNGRLVSVFKTVPDAPVSKFVLSLKGGDGGILAVTRSRARKFDVCRGRHVARVRADGQNGKSVDFGARLASPCRSRPSSHG